MTKAQTIKERLREAREHYEYTQTDLAQILNITQQTYSSYESGKSIPSTDVLMELANLYGISLDEFFGNPYIIRSSESVYVDEMTGKEVLTKLNYLNTSERRMLVAYLDFLIYSRRNRLKVNKVQEQSGGKKTM